MTSRLPSQSTSSDAEPEEERHARIEHALQPDQPRLRRDVLLVGGAEPLDLVRFLAVGADDADAGERLLHDRAELGELLLDRLEPPVDRAAEVPDR